MEIGLSFIEEPDGHNRCRNTFGVCLCRFKTDEEVSCLRTFFNLVSCSFSKKLEFEEPARSHWRMVNLSFLGLKWLWLAYWQAPASSFPLHSEVRHIVKATYCPPENAKYLKRLLWLCSLMPPSLLQFSPKGQKGTTCRGRSPSPTSCEAHSVTECTVQNSGLFPLSSPNVLQQLLWHGLKSVWRCSS